MTDAQRRDLEALAHAVCPHTYQGWPCEQPAGHPGSRHWSAGENGASVNWPSELSDRNVEQAAS